MIKEKSNNEAERRITQLKCVNFHRKKNCEKKSVKSRDGKKILRTEKNEKRGSEFFSADIVLGIINSIKFNLFSAHSQRSIASDEAKFSRPYILYKKPLTPSIGEQNSF